MTGDLASETARQLQRAARLRRSLEKSEHEAWKSGSLLCLVLSFIGTTLTVLVVAVLAVDGWLAYDVFVRDDTGTPATSSAAATEPTYSDLSIFDESGSFAGEVTITNPFDRDTYVIVTVNLYDGDQAVGEVTGTITLKPNSRSSVELIGFDDYAAYTDARVHLSGWQL
ncbi:MAG: hypothetical protein JWO11_891 [Nocardioides sp.]|nr:hypothetical protein [Nocardioides sp.]